MGLSSQGGVDRFACVVYSVMCFSVDHFPGMGDLVRFEFI
jgi:hypothetical protein